MAGSWEWAKKQMLAGHIINSYEWATCLKMRANSKTKALEIDTSIYESNANWGIAGMYIDQDVYTKTTSYVIYKWKTANEIFEDYMQLKLN